MLNVKKKKNHRAAIVSGGRATGHRGRESPRTIGQEQPTSSSVGRVVKSAVLRARRDPTEYSYPQPRRYAQQVGYAYKISVRPPPYALNIVHCTLYVRMYVQCACVVVKLGRETVRVTRERCVPVVCEPLPPRI